MIKLSTKINWKDYLTVVIIFAFFPPILLERLSDTMNKLQIMLQIAMMCLLFVMIILKRQLIIRKHTLMCWGVFCLYGLLITFFLAPNMIYPYCVNVIMPIFEVILICINYQNEENGMERLTKCMTFYWCFLILANLALLFLFPSGIIRSTAGATHDRANWLIGSKNNIVFPMVFAGTLILNSIHQGTKKKRIFHYGILLIAGYEILASGANGMSFGGGSTTGLVAYMLLFVLFAMRGIMHKTNLDARLSIIFVAVLFLIITVLLVHGATNPNSMFAKVAGMLGKDSTGSGRTEVWPEVVPLFLQSPILGNGFITRTFNGSLTSTYNFYLDLAYRYGICGICLMMLVFASYTKMGRPELYSMHLDRLDSLTFMIGFICLMVCGLVNTIRWQWLAMMLELYAYADECDYIRVTQPWIPILKENL